MTTTTINLLDKFRFENPQYNNIDDETLLKDIHTKYYSDMNFDEYKGKVLNTEAKFNNLANIQRFNMDTETEYDYCKNSNAIACITPERLKEIKNMKPMGIIEANRGIVSFFEDDDKARMNKISEKYNNGETLTKEEQNFIADFVDYQAQMQIRGITWKGKTINGFIQNIPTWIQTTLVKAAFEYGVVKMGTAGATIGASIGGPIGAGVGAVAGALTGKISKTIAEPIVQTLLMPHQIQANETERTFQGTFQLTPKGEVFINKLNQAEKELISKQAITSTFIENVNEAIWDALFPYIGSKLAKTKTAQAIAKSKLGKITQKVISNKLVKLINDKAPALKFSGLAGEEWEEIATDIMNNYITEDKTIAESFKDSLDRDWFVELGIISATGITTNITMRGLKELSKRGATSQEKAIFNSLKEEDKIRMLNELDEVEKQQFNNIKEQYKQDLKTIANYTDEQIDKGMEFHDKMFLYGFNYFNNDNLSINEWNKEYGFKILESVKGELKGGKELNQAINRNIDLEQEVNVLDISKSIEGKITKEKVKQKIQELIDKKEPIKTLSDPYMMELLNKKRSHIINGSRYGKLTPKEFKARNNQLLNVDTLIKNSVLIEKVENTKKDKKPDVDNYYYFYTPIKDGNNTYIVKLVAENSKKENIVNLYDILTEKELKVNDKGTKSLLGPSQARMETNNSSTLTIKQILSNVKDINGKNALESYMEENGLNQLSTINYQLSTPLGQYDITNRIMYLSKQSNITTFQHEMMHWWRQTVKTFADVGNKQAQIDMDTLNNYVGATTDSDWTREQEEVFARAWEQYLRRGIAPNKQLQSTFDKIREWFIEIYKTAKDIMYNGKPIELNKNIIEYFDKLINLDTIQQQDIETNYNIQYDKLKNEIDEARNILYQEEPDFTEEEINAILRERFKEQLTPLEELQYRIEQENKKTLKQKVNEIFNTYQYDKQEFKDLVNRVKTEIKDISKTIKNLKNGDVKIAEIDNQDLSIEDIIELRNIANKRLPRRPMTLTDFIKRKGGIWEGDKYGVGELQRIKGLVHKNPYMKVRDSQSGKINFIKRATVDDLRRASEEAGFLNRHSEVDDYDSQITLNDFLNALSDEESGTYYYRSEDRNKVLEYETLKEQQNQAGAILQKLEQDLNLDIDNILDIYNKAKENNFKIIDKDRIKLIQEESKKAQNDIKNIIKEIQSKERTIKQELNAELKEKINTIKEDLKNKALEEQQELKTEYKDKLNTIKQANKILTTDLKQGFKNKIKTVKVIQSKVIEMINQTNLDNENKAKFLSTIKNIQTEEDFIKNKDILIDRIQRYEQRQINKIIKNTINNELKHTKDIKKGNKRIGRYQYQDNLLFKDLRQYNKNTIFQNELALNDLMTTTPADKKNSTLYNIKERFLNYKINGLNNSIEFSQQVLKDIKDFKEIALENKNEVDAIRYNKKRLMFNELKQSIQQNKFGITGDKKISTKLYNWGYLTNGANQYSMMNFIFNKDIAEKYNMEIAENDYRIASFKRISEMNEKIELINDKSIDNLMLDWQNDTIDINVFDPERATNPDGLTYTETWNKLQLFDVYNAIKDKKTRQDYFDYYGQDKIESLVETLTSKERQTADVIYDAVQDYERLNEFVIKHYNKDLKRVENYWPKTSEHQQSIDILELNNGVSLQFNSENGTYGSFIKDRVQGSVKPITTNAYTKATGHINEVEYLLNVAEIYKQNKEIITNNDLSSMIKQKFGDNIFKNYSDIIANQSFSTKQKYISLSERLGQTLLNNYAAAKLGANPTSFARQLGAFTNYGIDAKNGFYKEVVNTLANFPQAWNYMKNLDWVQERLHSGSNIELSRILESKENIINLGKHLNVISKALNKLDIFKVLANLSSYGDLLSVVVGGYSQIQVNIKNGMTEAEAQLQCRKSTFRTQQSNLKASQSNLQNNNTSFIKRLFTMFTSATNQMKRNVADAMVQYSKGEISKGRIAEIITNYIFLQAANYVILGYLTNGAISAIGGMLGFDNDDEREKDKHTFGDFTLDIAQQILETITIDFPITRQLTSVGFETVKKKITGKGYYVNGFSFPIMNDLLKDFNKLASKKEYTLEDFLKGFGVDMTELLTGAPIKTAIRLNKKITGKDLLRN